MDAGNLVIKLPLPPAFFPTVRQGMSLGYSECSSQSPMIAFMVSPYADWVTSLSLRVDQVWNDHGRKVKSYLTTFPGFYETGDYGYIDPEG